MRFSRVETQINGEMGTLLQGAGKGCAEGVPSARSGRGPVRTPSRSWHGWLPLPRSVTWQLAQVKRWPAGGMDGGRKRLLARQATLAGVGVGALVDQPGGTEAVAFARAQHGLTAR